MTRAEKLEAAGAHMHCTCPHDDEGVRERGYIEHYDPDGTPHRDWYYLTNPTCPLHGPGAQEAPI